MQANWINGLYFNRFATSSLPFHTGVLICVYIIRIYMFRYFSYIWLYTYDCFIPFSALYKSPSISKLFHWSWFLLIQHDVRCILFFVFGIYCLKGLEIGVFSGGKLEHEERLSVIRENKSWHILSFVWQILSFIFVMKRLCEYTFSKIFIQKDIV